MRYLPSIHDHSLRFLRVHLHSDAGKSFSVAIYILLDLLRIITRFLQVFDTKPVPPTDFPSRNFLRASHISSSSGTVSSSGKGVMLTGIGGSSGSFSV
jgi:hypothetical protein